VEFPEPLGKGFESRACSQIPFCSLKSIFDHSKVDDFVKSRNKTAKKKDPDTRRANPEE